MRLLEIVRGTKTSKPGHRDLDAAREEDRQDRALVGVCHGFVGNRMLARARRRRTRCCWKARCRGTSTRCCTSSACRWARSRWPTSPASTSAGARRPRRARRSATCCAKWIRRGQKTGRGLLRLRRAAQRQALACHEKIIKDFLAKAGSDAAQDLEAEILERSVYPMINEGAKILEEKIAIRPSDIDIVWINGYGWPVYRGGPMSTATRWD
jgi:3-hydroxyacyl-CoA dehydrogenase